MFYRLMANLVMVIHCIFAWFFLFGAFLARQHPWVALLHKSVGGGSSPEELHARQDKRNTVGIRCPQSFPRSMSIGQECHEEKVWDWVEPIPPSFKNALCSLLDPPQETLVA